MLQQNHRIKHFRIIISLLPIFYFFSCPAPEPKGPDYIITDFIFPTTPQKIAPPPSSGTVTFKIKNKGKENGTNPVNANLYISPYHYYDNNAVSIPPGLTINALKAEESSSTQSLNYTIPVGATKTSFFLLKIDTSDKETDTFNNVSSSSPITVTDGIILRTILFANTPSATFNIGGFETQYYKFTTQTNYAYQIYWDDYSEGTLFQSATAANVKVSSATSDGLTTFFSQIDNGFNMPQTIFSANGVDINIDAATTGTGGQYSIRILDIGTPPNLTIQITGAAYNAGQNKLTVNYKITNNSTIGITGATFTVGFWANPGAAPTSATPTDLSAVLSNVNITPGGFITGSSIVTPPALVVTGSAYAYVDLLNNIVENNENDNLSAAVGW
jgi:hypothetical protein